MNARTQGFKIQDANRTEWIFFQYTVDVMSYVLSQGFMGTYELGMEYNTLTTTVHIQHYNVWSYKTYCIFFQG